MIIRYQGIKGGKVVNISSYSRFRRLCRIKLCLLNSELYLYIDDNPRGKKKGTYFSNDYQTSASIHRTHMHRSSLLEFLYLPVPNEVRPVLDDASGELLLGLRELEMVQKGLPENVLQLLSVHGSLSL